MAVAAGHRTAMLRTLLDLPVAYQVFVYLLDIICHVEDSIYIAWPDKPCNLDQMFIVAVLILFTSYPYTEQIVVYYAKQEPALGLQIP